jgi:hypothetical protein
MDLLKLLFAAQVRTQRIRVSPFGRNRIQDRCQDSRANWWIVANVKLLLMQVLLVVGGSNQFLNMKISAGFVDSWLFLEKSFSTASATGTCTDKPRNLDK